ncbi:MAG TPA: tripartite tricarboxylate transporter substrate-binding protein, partial [Xanthobacteraceae bacterium]|nr:tripartite tricarboxylate transporter substrate-binding protein [Xanthobacteraceae bacterium]
MPLRRRQGGQQSRSADRGREPSRRRRRPGRYRGRAPPDGYTLLCAAQLTFSVTHLLFSKASFDPRALEPVGVLATYPLILIARADLPFNSLQDLIAYARANPGEINYGHQGKGQTGHLLGELMMLKGKFRMTEIP